MQFITVSISVTHMFWKPGIAISAETGFAETPQSCHFVSGLLTVFSVYKTRLGIWKELSCKLWRNANACALQADELFSAFIPKTALKSGGCGMTGSSVF